MKKVLFASTALVAAGLMAAGSASASEKIKLELGGFSKWWVVGQWNEDAYQAANNLDFNSVDIKGDNEIHFGGSTALDNGMKVGVNVTLGAGGHTDNTIDFSYAYLETGFGKFIIGNNDNGTKLLHVSAPDAAGNIGTDGVITGGFAIQAPTAFDNQRGGLGTVRTTAIDTDGNAEKITYVAPTFMGLTLGATYVPNSTAHNRGLVDLNAAGTTASEIYGVGGLYANTFGDVDLKLSGGWVTYDVELGLPGNTGVDEYSAGLALDYAGFTIGGSYRDISGESGIRLIDSNAWDVGVQYATGPYAVSLLYFKSKTEGTTAITAENEFTVYQVSGSYNLGAGVDVLATVGHAEYDAETTTAATNNKGWSVMTGLGLSF